MPECFVPFSSRPGLGKGVKASEAKIWKSRKLPVQFFGVIRHHVRADGLGTTWNGGSWCDSSDFRLHPNDPPLSDEGIVGAQDIGRQLGESAGLQQGGAIHVIVTSPYFRCVQTACEIAKMLGTKVRLMVDLCLSEIHGPEIFGDHKPDNVLRCEEDIRAYISRFNVESVKCFLGHWPVWPETLMSGRKRYMQRVLAYLSRATKTRRNFLLVSHADCVAATVAIMPSVVGRCVESVGFGGMLLAARKTGQALHDEVAPLSLANVSQDDDPGHETETGVAQVLDDLNEVSWSVQVSNVQLGHKWCADEERALRNAMNALKSNQRNGARRQQEIEVLLGVLPKTSSGQHNLPSLHAYVRQHDANCNISRATSGSTMSMSTETWMFGRSCSDHSHAVLADPPRSSRLGLFTVVEVSDTSQGDSMIDDASAAGSPVLFPAVPDLVVPKISSSKLMQRRGSL